MFDLRTYLPYLLNRVGVALVDRFSEELCAESLTVSMWRVLAVLRHDGPQHMSELSELTSIELSTLSRLTGSLQRRGLTTRKRGGSDARYVRVALTPRGKTLTERLLPKALALEERLVGAMPARDVAALKRLLDVLYANIRSQDMSSSLRHSPAERQVAPRKRSSLCP
ncbi:MAG TPA: MarR family winged helix-turn-helix transcriptional regulator [Candidatus Binatia bacterium]|nr:MarR family winged helix-turn-helix transcriptional regulator [Candidatus Binatia bacterium]